jgi:hypothetical protein
VKVAKFIDIPSVEVEIEISGEEAMQAIVDDPGDWSWDGRLKYIVNHLAQFFKQLPDDIIAQQNDGVKQIIATFFREQAERFVPTPKSDGGAPFDAAVDRVIAKVDKGLEGKL